MPLRVIGICVQSGAIGIKGQSGASDPCQSGSRPNLHFLLNEKIVLNYKSGKGCNRESQGNREMTAIENFCIDRDVGAKWISGTIGIRQQSGNV